MQVNTNDLLREIEGDTFENAQSRAMSTFDQSIKDSNGQVILFGCGSMGRRVLASLRRDGIEPAAFSDNNPALWGTPIDGLCVLSPTQAAERFGTVAVFIVTVYNYTCSFLEIRDQLRALGCSRISSVLPVRWKYHSDFLPYFRDDLPVKVLEERSHIFQAAELWADSVSRDVFIRQVHWRLFGGFEVLSVPEPGTQYFPPDLVDLAGDECLVDCGAFDGDSIASFLAACKGRFQAVHAMEPDPPNVAKLTKYIMSLLPEQRRKISVHPVAVGSATSVVRFSSGRGVASSIDPGGDIEVPCRRIDDLLSGQRVTHLKMDIEGAEPEALIGARQLIERERPRLSICLYHLQNHLWRIPLWISQKFPDYELFLKSHQPDCWDTIVYALQPALHLTPSKVTNVKPT